MSRTKGSRNKKPARERYIYVRMTADLHAWVLAHAGRSESDTVVRLLEACRAGEAKTNGQTNGEGRRT